MDEIEYAWYSTDGGRTVGRRGPEGGHIVADAEWGDPDDDEAADARLTIERADAGGFVITAQLYGGWLYFSRPTETLDQAEALADRLRDDLTRLSDQIPEEDERDIPRKVAALNQAIAEVEAAY